MKKMLIWIGFTVIWLFVGCQQKTIQNSFTSLSICDVNEIRETRTINLSEWVEDFQIIRFENSDTALFRMKSVAITDNYIGICQHGQNAFKLFDRKGNFLCDVGQPGGGPGEYSYLSSGIIDENKQRVCLAESYGSNIHVYNMNGFFLNDINMDTALTKPRMTLHSDGSISIIQLSFKEDGFPPIITNINKDGEITTIEPIEPLKAKLVHGGIIIGHSNETWCYNNTSDMYFMQTFNDTLYCYNIKDNSIKPTFTLTGQNKTEGMYYVFNPIPGKIIANIVKKGRIAYDLQTNESYYFELKNDFVGGMKVSPNFIDGYFFMMYEPQQLMERIEKRLKESDCTDADKKILKELYDSLDEDDNNIMFIGKLKK